MIFGAFVCLFLAMIVGGSSGCLATLAIFAFLALLAAGINS